MSWIPRRLSLTDYYHLIMRGNNKQVLFEAPDDYRFFISRLGRYCHEGKIGISAYCLMENHVHIRLFRSIHSAQHIHTRELWPRSHS